MEPEFLGCFSVTFPGASEKVVLFLRTEYSKRKFVFHFQALAAIIWQKELISTNDKRDPGRSLPASKFAYHLPYP